MVLIEESKVLKINEIINSSMVRGALTVMNEHDGSINAAKRKRHRDNKLEILCFKYSQVGHRIRDCNRNNKINESERRNYRSRNDVIVGETAFVVKLESKVKKTTTAKALRQRRGSSDHKIVFDIGVSGQAVSDMILFIS